jgi:uncharacterized membrane protein (TIGR01666 family)
MSTIKAYKSFINGRFLNEGLRITAGIVLPSFIMSFFGMLPTGLVMSLGALCVSVTDSPGPVRHRRNGMLVCIALITALSVVVYYASGSVFLLGLLIFLSGFVFSMLTVYGIRSSSIGIAALIVMVLSMESPLHGNAIWLNALYIFAGGIWYMLYSLLLYRIRPYKIIQQVLGDFIIGISAYLRTRASFYATEPDYEKTYRSLLEQQVHIEAQQKMLSDLLFKTRTIVKESTHTSRVLLKIYLDAADLFESVMTTYQQYTILHQHFDETGILGEYGQIIETLADELQEIGLAIKSGTRSSPKEAVLEKIKRTRQHFESLRKNYMMGEKVDDFISLGRIIHNLEDMAEKINELHHYTSYDRQIRRHEKASVVLDSYKESEDIRLSLFYNNLNFKSNVFRHSLRVGLALLMGYIISVLFHTGHSYWILLTIVVILKPAYSLTKTRNKDRLIGTILGLFIGGLVLLLVKNNTALLVIMIIFMTGSYVFIRTNYFLAVVLMTPELLILFHLLAPGSLMVVLKDRLIDTAIGSAIALVASLFLVPAWEHSSIKNYMVNMLEAIERYYTIIANGFTGRVPPDTEALSSARRDVLVALANLSDAFTRMLSEPKRFQKGIENIHRFVVLTHTLISHLATLSYYLNVRFNNFRSPTLIPVIENTRLHFNNAIHCLEGKEGNTIKPNKGPLKMVNEYANSLLEKRKTEIAQGQLETETKKILVETKSVIDQFNYIYGIAASLSKTCRELD